MLNLLINYIENTPQKMISYADYIQQALYHSEYGYYMKDAEKIGPGGDFITTSNVSDIYGRTISKWFHQMAGKYKLPFHVCEIGGGNGRFAKAFLDEWNLNADERIHYYIFETSPYHRKLQKEQIVFSEHIRQIDSWNEIAPFCGLIFSNELFDALPVHVVEKVNDQLHEIMVTIKDGKLAETAVPLTNRDISLFLEESGLSLSNGQRIEIPLQMEQMIKSISAVLDKGFVLTADYGYTDEEWQEPMRRDGSLRGYYRHSLINNVLEHPGEMDITSHIHFDSLIRLGEKEGLNFHFMMRQDEFLLSAGILQELENHYDPNPFSPVSKRNRAIRSLITPSGMSAAFHLILQGKKIGGK
ncbi:class I SAM-dependent methyltransferase [Cytobacillus firmus]|uniref:class I SAM-dependent methyltransferase n=1 Tax=Cytobacillus firmus TaxID=1399 RepID=UPI0015806689|nr:SAM-dependent methyltransferase [Cytobacillus firmus]MBG9548588.1 cytoplasmic protein [Cytobacillus firmus]MBG9603009.1 cytoplasmic protein [Cytobacillus firmus]MBG9654894.1 cytoplasmic protein [Cytobacillus firmus]MDD9311001.1 SAM-dependent methyltransferase [Cytobacillus firmus]MED1906962.1 SAM-dependent methyltransferase [Cytobacillus firmus]